MNFPRLRFSLLTLVFAVLLIGSAAVLWWNLGPWGVVRTFSEDGAVLDVEFTPDDRHILTQFLEPLAGTEKKFQTILTLRDPDTGKLVHRWHCGDSAGGFTQISPLGTSVQFFAYEKKGAWQVNITHCWRLDNGDPVDFSRIVRQKLHALDFSKNENFAALYEADRCVVLKMPELKVIREFKTTVARRLRFSPDERHFAIVIDGELQLVSTDAGVVEQRYSISSSGQATLDFSDDGTLLALGILDSRSMAKSLLFNLKLGKQIAKFDGERYPIISPDGKYVQTNGALVKGGVWSSIVRRMSALDVPVAMGPEFANFTRSDGRIFHENMYSEAGVWDRQTGQKLWGAGDKCGLSFSWNQDYATVFSGDKRLQIVDAHDGKSLYRFRDFGALANESSNVAESWAYNRPDFISYCYIRGKPNHWSDYNEPTPANRRIAYWSKTRPEQWYGVAWLPEFWLTVVLSAALLWSIVRRAPSRMAKTL